MVTGGSSKEGKTRENDGSDVFFKNHLREGTNKSKGGEGTHSHWAVILSSSLSKMKKAIRRM